MSHLMLQIQVLMYHNKSVCSTLTVIAYPEVILCYHKVTGIVPSVCV